MESDTPSHALEFDGADLGECHRGTCRRFNDSLADKDFPRSSVVCDARREIHCQPVVVAVLKQDRASVKPDMGGRQPSCLHVFGHLERCDDGRPRITEPEHHPVPEPLDRLPTMFL